MHVNYSERPPWDIQAARNLYNIQSWGARYFDINEAGHVVARPLQEAGASVDVTDVIEEAKGRGLKFPLLIRFQDLLRSRVTEINTAFRKAIEESGYGNTYVGVYPIKVNQLHERPTAFGGLSRNDNDVGRLNRRIRKPVKARR